jgi:hypothetical protein
MEEGRAAHVLGRAPDRTTSDRQDPPPRPEQAVALGPVERWGPARVKPEFPEPIGDPEAEPLVPVDEVLADERPRPGEDDRPDEIAGEVEESRAAGATVDQREAGPAGGAGDGPVRSFPDPDR